MDAVLRGASIYLILLLLFRFAGKRSIGQITTFDFVLLLIIGEATQQALLGEDFSTTNAAIVVTTLIGMEIGFGFLKRAWPWLDRIIEGLPLVIVENGRPLTDRLRRSRVDESDILAAAREIHGLEKMSQIKYAILERSGTISIIPNSG